MRVRALRKPPGAILNEPAERVSVALLERRAQRHGLAAPACCFAERAMAARKGEQREGLIVEIEARVRDLAVKAHHRYDRGVRSDEVLAKIFKRVVLCLTPGTRPAEPAGFAIGECLASDHPRTMRLRQGAAVEANGLVKSAPDAIRTSFPP